MTDVTGRDRHIITKALAYAIETISVLPERDQERSDQADMKRLLEAMVDSDIELQTLLGPVQRKIRKAFLPD